MTTGDADVLILTIEPAITGVIPHKEQVYDTLELREPRAGEMRVANAHVRGGVNMQSVYLRNAHLISAVSKRSGMHWPVTAVEQLPDSIFTEAADFLLGFSERAHIKAMQSEMKRIEDTDDETATGS